MLDKKKLEEYKVLEREIASLKMQIADKRNQMMIYRKEDSNDGMRNRSEKNKPVNSSGHLVRDKWKRIQDLEIKLSLLMEACVEQKLEVEEFIADIDDVTTRLIFRYLFLENLTQKEVERKVHLDQSVISKRVTRYLKLHSVHKNT
ncbi:hypothetical protein [uncultured Robinsoniella sp.]|uniref:hypothetical protein n=1 Tax=uncultured Robinsoniella sp. TaxID=904190 RepID=UPI00374F2D9A